MVTAPTGTAKAWHCRTVEETWADLVSGGEGLSSVEAEKRLAANGPNQLREAKPVRPIHILLRQFKGLLVWVLLAAGTVSFLLGEVLDGAAIVAIIVLNAVIGFYQEFQAETSIAALKRLTSPRARVWRGGKVTLVQASAVVAGDLLDLEAGDLVAADARVVKAASLKCVESALTGESDAVAKQTETIPDIETPLGDRTNLLFMGTSVAAGTGRAVVVATGMGTELGRIATLLEKAGEDEGTPLQKRLASVGRVLVWATFGIVGLLFALGYWRGTAPIELFLTSVSLAVAAVPEGLPAVVTVALALGVSRMSRRAALVRRLPAVETLGSTTVICTDKTGTLTVGEMTVRRLRVAGQPYEVTGEGYGPGGEFLLNGKTVSSLPDSVAELALGLVASANAHLEKEKGVWRVIGDPTEGALLALGLKAGWSQERVEREFPKADEIPFDSDRKRSTVLRRLPSGVRRAFTNGAPDQILPLCTHLYTLEGVRPMTDMDRETLLAENASLAGQALRVLGSARRDLGPDFQGPVSAETVERELVFVGLTGMYDPPRPEGKEAVAKCRAAGIRVIMITGDHPQTALAIARELGIATEETACTGTELDGLSEEDLKRRVLRTHVYARVSAEHKLRIIRAWKSHGAVVAMTGDGVNDAPAIMGADIGIAMGRTGTEVTKQASDMVITDDNFATIVAAVEEGRGIYDNIQKTLQYLLAGNTAEILLMAVCVVAGMPAPLLPIHLLWVNLVTDGLPALCLATDPIDADVMRHPPRRSTARIMDGRFLGTMVFTGVLTAGVSLGVFLAVLKTGDLELARTQAFTVLVFSELLRSFGSRDKHKPVWRISWLSNLPLLLVVAFSLGLQFLSLHNRMFGGFLKSAAVPLAESLPLLAFGTIPLLTLELVKIFRNRGVSRAK